jgi:murein DD-endopeptidase MepM/ murein hydrolase activator NlpD
VLAADGGIVTEVCNDGEQATYQIFHHDAETTRYLHLAANSIDPSIDGQTIPRGWWLGNLYDGTVGAGPCTINGNPALCQFNTPCGLGSGPHLHFEISDMNATVNSWPISIVGNAPPIWLSSNAPVYPCSRPTAAIDVARIVSVRGQRARQRRRKTARS